jgi:hypothetical protein
MLWLTQFFPHTVIRSENVSSQFSVIQYNIQCFVVFVESRKAGRIPPNFWDCKYYSTHEVRYPT